MVRLNRGTDGDSYPQHSQRPGDVVTEESHQGVDDRPGVSARSEVFLQVLLCQWSQDGPEASRESKGIVALLLECRDELTWGSETLTPAADKLLIRRPVATQTSCPAVSRPNPKAT